MFVGLAEAADILGWARTQITIYIKRNQFPKPIKILKCGPIWTEDQITLYRDNRILKIPFYYKDGHELYELFIGRPMQKINLNYSDLVAFLKIERNGGKRFRCVHKVSVNALKRAIHDPALVHRITLSSVVFLYDYGLLDSTEYEEYYSMLKSSPYFLSEVVVSGE